MNTILALTDFSPAADKAVQTGIYLAKQHKANLHILHSMPEDSSVYIHLSSDNTNSHVAEGTGSQLHTYTDKWQAEAAKSGVHVSIVISSGDVVNATKRLLADQAMDIVIVGSTGSGNSEGIWGTTTQQIVKQLPSPVLVVKEQVLTNDFSTIVFASDLDPEDQVALKGSLSLLAPPADASIHLVSVNTSSYFTQPRALMTQLLADFKQLAAPYKATTSFYRDYSVTAGINHYVEETAADLLIMSCRKRSPIKDLFVPDPAVTAVGSVPCPILIMK